MDTCFFLFSKSGDGWFGVLLIFRVSLGGLYVHKTIKTAKVINREISFYHLYLTFPKFGDMLSVSSYSSCESLRFIRVVVDTEIS
jgi:hypothetical protein